MIACEGGHGGSAAIISRQVGNTQDSVGHVGASSIISTNERSLEDFM